MAKYRIAKQMKYEGVIYAPNTTIEVKKEHIEQFKALGGWEVKGRNPNAKETPIEYDIAQELEDLREEAKALKIKVDKRWGVAKINELIDKKKGMVEVKLEDSKDE